MNDWCDKIILGNCVDLLKTFPDNTFDLAFADPPFNLAKNYGVCEDKMDDSEYIAWSEAWQRELVRVTKPTGSIVIHHIPNWLIQYANILNRYAVFKAWIAWDALSAPRGKKLLPAHYGFLHYEKVAKGSKFHQLRHPHKRCFRCEATVKSYGGKKKNLHPFGPLVSDVWVDIPRMRNKDSRKERHPCQLPVPVMERIILMTTDEGDQILDPFMGSGTTAIAAKQMGRHFTGIEIDPQYKMLAERYLQEVQVSKIGEAYVSQYKDKIFTIRDEDWETLLKPHFVLHENPADIELKPIRLA